MYPVRNFFSPFVFDSLSPLMDACNAHTAISPRINVKESDACYTVEMAAAGMSKDDLQVHINDEGNLMVKMEKHEEKSEKAAAERYLRHEFSTSNFTQTFILPDDVEKSGISAAMQNGILTVTLPKVQPVKEKLARQINIE